ncbi:MAG TPA: hypothetical protein PKE26_02920 [Kiritimatiellia bacterium]|nr:hypothetical protein [Kiritimatiellia bacterium]HMO98041.1 hypothetical protein [Kiritimatiellia bacterium]HMP96566.1 hypothetical protein [Kiritimatiellia bacterium]
MRNLSAVRIRPVLWPQRLIDVRRSLHRSSRMIVALGLLALSGNVFWVWHERGPRPAAFDPLEIDTWYHPAYVNSILIAMIMLYALRQVTRTREKLEVLGYPLLEREDQHRGVEIWRSIEPLSKRPVHLHVIRPEKFPGGQEDWHEASQRWLRRADKARRLASPHIAHLIDSGFADGRRFYAAMELIQGLPLETFIEEHGPCPPERAVYLLAQMAHALDDAHRCGIFPVALAPRNIRIGKQASNCDWIWIDLFQYEQVAGAEPNRAQDIRQLAKLAIGLLTGIWNPDDAPEVSAEIDQRLSAPPIPYPFRRELLAWLNADGSPDAPSPLVLVERLSRTVAAPVWDNERATAWWQARESGKQA